MVSRRLVQLSATRVHPVLEAARCNSGLKGGILRIKETITFVLAGAAVAITVTIDACLVENHAISHCEIEQNKRDVSDVPRMWLT